MDLEEAQERFRPPSYLLCPICLEVFVTPRLLPCSHTVCAQCVGGMLSQAPYAVMTSEGVQASTHINCPLCRSGLHRSVAAQLPTNRALEEAVTDWKARTNSDRLIWIKGCITQCRVHEQPAEFWCSQCTTNVCAHCCSETSTSGGSGCHSKQLLEDFPGFCENRAQLVNEFMISQPRVTEVGEVVRHLSKKQSDVMDIYLDFVRDMAAMQTAISYMLELKLEAGLVDASNLLTSLQIRQQGVRSGLLKRLQTHCGCFTDNLKNPPPGQMRGQPVGHVEVPQGGQTSLEDLRLSRSQLEADCERASGEDMKELDLAEQDLRISLRMRMRKMRRIEEMLMETDLIPRPLNLRPPPPSLRRQARDSVPYSIHTSVPPNLSNVPEMATAGSSPTALTTTEVSRPIPSAAIAAPSAPIAGVSAATTEPSAAIAGPSAAIAGPSAAIAGSSAAIAGPSADIAGPRAAITDRSAARTAFTAAAVSTSPARRRPAPRESPLPSEGQPADLRDPVPARRPRRESPPSQGDVPWNPPIPTAFPGFVRASTLVRHPAAPWARPRHPLTSYVVPRDVYNTRPVYMNTWPQSAPWPQYIQRSHPWHQGIRESSPWQPVIRQSHPVFPSQGQVFPMSHWPGQRMYRPRAQYPVQSTLSSGHASTPFIPGAISPGDVRSDTQDLSDQSPPSSARQLFNNASTAGLPVPTDFDPRNRQGQPAQPLYGRRMANEY